MMGRESRWDIVSRDNNYDRTGEKCQSRLCFYEFAIVGIMIGWRMIEKWVSRLLVDVRAVVSDD